MKEDSYDVSHIVYIADMARRHNCKNNFPNKVENATSLESAMGQRKKKGNVRTAYDEVLNDDGKSW